MPHFLLIATDKPDSLTTRLAHRPAHLDYLARWSNHVRLAGPMLDQAGNPTGSTILLEIANRKEAEQFAAKDPYALAGLFAKIEIKLYRITIDSMSKQPLK